MEDALPEAHTSSIFTFDPVLPDVFHRIVSVVAAAQTSPPLGIATVIVPGTEISKFALLESITALLEVEVTMIL